jgi:hypothetical protein
MMKRIRRVASNDDGLGILTVVFVMAVVSALAITATSLTVNNLGNARRDRQSLTAMATSEAGVSQAIQYLRGSNLASLTCTEPAAGSLPGATCNGATASWISAAHPMEVNTDGTTGCTDLTKDCFKVWIGTVTPYVPNCAARHASPPGQCYAVYRVHSTGISGNGPGARKLAVDVKVAPYSYPMGVFSEQTFSGNGSPTIHQESIFTAGCMYNRQDDSHPGSGTQFEYDSAAGRTKVDLVYDQPTAAHAVGVISSSNQSCTSNAGGSPIHESSACNATFKYDQDGGVPTGTDIANGDNCYGKYTRADGTKYPTTAKFTLTDLENLGYRPRGLTDAQYDRLRSQAQAEGTYNLASGTISGQLTTLTNAGVTSPVLFWDTGDISLGSSDFPAAMKRALNSSATCGGDSVTVIVMNGNLTYQGGGGSPYVPVAFFVPDGTLKAQGGLDTLGTIFAKVVDMGGSPDFKLDNCFVNNPPGGTLDAQVINWREDDSKDVN